MKTFFVIRNARDNTYLSVSGNWDIFFLSAEFDSEESAIKEIERWDGYFVIEKVYNI
jgi:hypothetical protein